MEIFENEIERLNEIGLLSRGQEKLMKEDRFTFCKEIKS